MNTFLFSFQKRTEGREAALFLPEHHFSIKFLTNFLVIYFILNSDLLGYKNSECAKNFKATSKNSLSGF